MVAQVGQVVRGWMAGVSIPPPAALGVGMADRGRSTDPSHPAAPDESDRRNPWAHPLN